MLLSGKAPWVNSNQSELSKMIMGGKLELNSCLSITQDAKSFIKGLLTLNIEKRSGCGKEGINGLKNHRVVTIINISG